MEYVVDLEACVPDFVIQTHRGGATAESSLSSSLQWLAGSDAGRRSRRLDVTLCSRSATAVSVGSHRANYLRYDIKEELIR